MSVFDIDSAHNRITDSSDGVSLLGRNDWYQLLIILNIVTVAIACFTGVALVLYLVIQHFCCQCAIKIQFSSVQFNVGGGKRVIKTIGNAVGKLKMSRHVLEMWKFL